VNGPPAVPRAPRGNGTSPRAGSTTPAKAT
jgi:hypothetical protein